MNIRYPLYEGVYRILTIHAGSIIGKGCGRKQAEEDKQGTVKAYIQQV